MIMKGGPALRNAMFNLCSVVWRTEIIPENWEKTTLIQLYKGKGPRNNLGNMRYIHVKNEFPKFFGHMVASAAKPTILSNMSKFQIATKPNHRVQEHIFVLKSVMGMYMSLGKALVLQIRDLSKYFDSESLVDCMNEIYTCGIHGKLYRLLYNLKRNTKLAYPRK